MAEIKTGKDDTGCTIEPAGKGVRIWEVYLQIYCSD